MTQPVILKLIIVARGYTNYYVISLFDKLIYFLKTKTKIIVNVFLVLEIAQLASALQSVCISTCLDMSVATITKLMCYVNEKIISGRGLSLQTLDTTVIVKLISNT
jgi:hypothetical protein